MAFYYVKYNHVNILSYHIDSFPGNCGYRVISGDKKYNLYSKFTENEQRYINRLIMYKLSTSTLPMIRMVVLSEVTRTNLWLYSFVKDNNLPMSEPVKINTQDPTNEKTVLSFFSPFNLKDTLKKPRKHNSVKLNDHLLTIEGPLYV